MDEGNLRGDRVVVAIGGGAVVLVGAFGGLWIVFGDARTAAIVELVVVFTVIIFAGGMVITHMLTRRTIEHMAAAFSVRPPVRGPVIDGDYELREPDSDLVSVDDRLMVRQDQIDRNRRASLSLSVSAHATDTRRDHARHWDQLERIHWGSAAAVGQGRACAGWWPGT